MLVPKRGMSPIRRYVLFGAGLFISMFMLSQILFGPRQTIRGINQTTHQILKAAQQPLSAAESIPTFWSSIRFPVNAPTYTDENGKQFNLTGRPHWRKSLGKDILIVDIDTRQPTGYNQIFNDTMMDWTKLGDGAYMDNNIALTSEAIMTHYLYAQIHGYDYIFYQAEEIGDQTHTWVKVHAIPELLERYKFVVFLDADVSLHHYEIPMEWMFNKWRIGPTTSLALPTDVTREDCITCDSRGNVMLNTGVIIAQNLPHTFKIFEAWKTCTNETRYKGCAEWAHNWAHEQRALSEYIRYDSEMNGEDNIRAIPCDDANGYPEKNDVKDAHMKFYSDCQGNFIQHHWLDGGKEIAKRAIGNAIMQSVSQVVQKALWAGQDAYVLNKTAQYEEGEEEWTEEYNGEEDSVQEDGNENDE